MPVSHLACKMRITNQGLKIPRSENIFIGHTKSKKHKNASVQSIKFQKETDISIHH